MTVIELTSTDWVLDKVPSLSEWGLEMENRGIFADGKNWMESRVEHFPLGDKGFQAE